MRLVIAAGGTAGHIYPGLALARSLVEQGHHVSFVGTVEHLEASLVPAAGFDFHPVRARPFVRRVSLAAVKAPFVALATVGECRPLVRGADAVVGMGGYVSVPAVIAARRERVPIVLHEQNAVPGLANRLLSRISGNVALSFADAARFFPQSVRLTVTGNPVREEILRVPEERQLLAKEGREELGVEDGRRTVVIFGGSQGALHIDRAAIGACHLLANRADLQILLITGRAHLEMIQRAASPAEGGIVVRLIGYLERMELAYACADLVVSRSGATTVAEVSVCGLPALLIPYPYATGRHQEANARALQRSGGASIMLDDQLSAEALARRIESLIDHPERLKAMAERSRAYGRPEAADRLAAIVVDQGRGRGGGAGDGGRSGDLPHVGGSGSGP
jgi:UDP-N-acetylglucosamine--N-acetylmuramyl-(pentapeptide) pyrophosphoryl-undecaprenol N-acetylglucosamine transferase